MEARPIIKPLINGFDRIVDLSALILLILFWIFVIYIFSSLPQRIPIHFDANGIANGYGDKSTMIILPIVATILFFGFTVLLKYPHIYNYPVAITEENAECMYTATTRLLRVIKLVIVIIFFSIVIMSWRVAVDKNEGIGEWVLPVFLALIFIPIIIYFIRIFAKLSPKR